MRGRDLVHGVRFKKKVMPVLQDYHAFASNKASDWHLPVQLALSQILPRLSAIWDVAKRRPFQKITRINIFQRGKQLDELLNRRQWPHNMPIL